MDELGVPLLFVRGTQRARRLPSIDVLEAFLAVVEQGHVARAGRTLGLSQPAMSARLRRLEDDLGLVLFSRSGRSLVPTPDAQRLAPRIRAALRGLASTLGDEGGAEDAVVRMGTLPTFTSHLLAPWLARTRAVVHHALSPALVDDLRRSALDVVVAAGPPPRDARLAVTSLGAIVPAAVASRSHRPSLPRAVRATDLLRRRLAVVPRAGEPFFDGVRSWVEDEGLDDRVTLTVPHLQSLLALASASDLVAIVPSYMTLSDERVVARPIVGLDLRVPVWMARRRSDARPEVRALEGQLVHARATLSHAMGKRR